MDAADLRNAASFEKRDCAETTSPQGLKPNVFADPYGTDQPVPLQSMHFPASCKVGPLQSNAFFRKL
jgi:hypothetical protein